MATEKQRPAGWYWVKLSESLPEAGGWSVLRFESRDRLNPGGKWFPAGSPIHLPDGVIHTVGPRIPTPDDPWQCVPTHTPTIDMTEAGMSHVMRGQDYERAQACWKAMLAAAPKP